jgi:NADPH:quinone reductase-like Zn-dependent oxidoreductase
MADLAKHLAEGRLQHRIAARLPLEELARANELIEQGELRGCVVVDIGD